MNNFDRNTRTLIVSFLIAVFALIPLRFIEAGQQQEFLMESKVLGEIMEEPVQEVIEEPIVEIVEDTFELEPSYDESEECFSQEELDISRSEISRSYEVGYISKEEVEAFLIELDRKQTNICP